ncbi:glutathione S-transferase family protein [Pseudaminobacter salicylatoxidans]|uniref:glutathione S-transferase family protein n=1 Tax=Pseudaminobacter salicylatoxidans TaxID=93369 RepID=UPI0002E0AA5B|nr:glutathione S-transferase family protein [Pseudaminobacter salicylatoxidans]
MYKLYTRPGSGGFVAEAAFALADVPYERINVAKSEAADPQFRVVSPLGQVPALALPEGGSMTESAAICILLGERYPEAGLAPGLGDEARADFLRWMAFLSSALYPAVLRRYYAPRYTADPAGKVAVEDAATAEIDRLFAVVDAQLAGRDWLAGERLSLADVYLLMLYSWHPEAEGARGSFPNVERVCEGLRQHPVLRELNAAHELW